MKKIFFHLALAFCFNANAQFFEGFEGAAFPPEGWLVTDNGVGPSVSWVEGFIYPAYEGVKKAHSNRENVGANNTSEEWLVTPAILISNNSVLSFYSRQGLPGNQNTIYEIRVSTTSQSDRNSFVTMQAFTEPDISNPELDYRQQSVSMGQFAGQAVYIAFVKVQTQLSIATEGDRWLLDAISIDGVLKKSDSAPKTHFSIHPNPAQSIVNIDTDTPIKSVEILNYTGQLIIQTAETNQIDVSNLASGVYFINVNSDKGKSTQKFLKL